MTKANIEVRLIFELQTCRIIKTLNSRPMPIKSLLFKVNANVLENAHGPWLRPMARP